MELLKASRFLNFRQPPSEPTVTFCLEGAIRLHQVTVELMGLKPGDHCIFIQDETGDCLIGKADKKHHEEGFTLRQYDETKTLQFRSKALVRHIAKSKDWALATDKKTSIRCKLKTCPVEWNGLLVYEIEM